MSSTADGTDTGARPEARVWTDVLIVVLAIAFGLFIVFLLIGMATHTGDRPTIFHSWHDFYSWTINSNFAGLLLGLLVPTIPLATIATVHHRRTTARLQAHNDLLVEHHRLLRELHSWADPGDPARPPSTATAPEDPGPLAP